MQMVGIVPLQHAFEHLVLLPNCVVVKFRNDTFCVVVSIHVGTLCASLRDFARTHYVTLCASSGRTLIVYVVARFHNDTFNIVTSISE